MTMNGAEFLKPEGRGQVTPPMSQPASSPRAPSSNGPILDVIPVASRPPVMDAILLPPLPLQPAEPILDVIPVASHLAVTDALPLPAAEPIADVVPVESELVRVLEQVERIYALIFNPIWSVFD